MMERSSWAGVSSKSGGKILQFMFKTLLKINSSLEPYKNYKVQRQFQYHIIAKPLIYSVCQQNENRNISHYAGKCQRNVLDLKDWSDSKFSLSDHLQKRLDCHTSNANDALKQLVAGGKLQMLPMGNVRDRDATLYHVLWSIVHISTLH